MLNAYPKDHAEGSALASHSWIDLLDPTDAERSAFETAFGLRVPSNEALREIEATSRLRVEDGALYMTAPMIFASGNEPWLPTPTGFVLSK
jgi:magnesium transporter